LQKPSDLSELASETIPEFEIIFIFYEAAGDSEICTRLPFPKTKKNDTNANSVHSLMHLSSRTDNEETDFLVSIVCVK
jgi:hypothetical protein